jgi:hypothetical protein
MRAGSLLLLVLFGCNTSIVDGPENPPDSVRQRLTEGETRLLFSTADSAGTITAHRRISGSDWESGLVDLKIDQGEVAATADAAGAITIERLAIKLAPIAIPASVFNREAALTNVRAELAAPAVITTTWTDDDTAHLSAALDLHFSWALTVEGNTSVLGEPDLPPVNLEIDVTGDGSFVHADVRAGAGGELWAWAGLIKLSDLSLVLGADTP